MKKIGVMFFIYLTILLLANISAENCTIVPKVSCAYNEIMGLSAPTNAHGELLSEGNYDYVLCCNFGTGSTDCSLGNVIIKLENRTNSHAEIPDYNNYDNPICYENLVCTNRDSCNPTELEVLSLTNLTDAHIGEAGDYPVKICCEGVCGTAQEFIDGQCVDEAIAYWADSDEGMIDGTYDVVVGSTQLMMVLKNSGLSEGTIVGFDIYEEDLMGYGYLRTINATVDSEGNAKALWTVTQEDIDKALESPLEGELDNFYFNVLDFSSNNIQFNLINRDSFCSSIGICRDYTSEEDCEADICSVASISIENNDGGDSCGEVFTDGNCQIWYTCSCEWVDGYCGPSKTDNLNCSDENPVVIGSCFYKENTTDDCEDGFLEYSWLGIYTWDSGNIFGSEKQGEPGWVEEPNGSGNWHYDPNNNFGACEQEGTNRIPCPVAALLPLFSIISILIALGIIVIIYYLLSKKKKSKTKR